MIGDREDPVPARLRRGHHLFERRLRVARQGRVHVEVADDVADGPRKRPLLGGLDLAGVLAKDRRDQGEAERLVDLLFGLAGDHLAALDLGERVLVERPARGRARACAA